MIFFGKRKPRVCAVCGCGLDENCGLKYTYRAKRYAPNGFYSVVPIKGAVCEPCLKALNAIILEARNGGLRGKEKLAAS